MKKVLITALSLVMVGSVLLSAAGQGPKGGREIVRITGEITDISDQLLTVVAVDETETTVQVTDDTVVTAGGGEIDFDDLLKGDIVKVRGKMLADVLVADKITVKCVVL